MTDILTSAGVQPIRPPPKSPNLNAYAERFVRSITEECFTRVVPLGEGHLHLLAREYVEHYLATTKDSTTGFCSTRHRRSAGPPTCSGAIAWADFSISTIERPRDWSAH